MGASEALTILVGVTVCPRGMSVCAQGKMQISLSVSMIYYRIPI
jgi:hypothetical protein